MHISIGYLIGISSSLTSNARAVEKSESRRRGHHSFKNPLRPFKIRIFFFNR